MDCSHPRALIEPIITLGDLVTEDGQVNNSFLENLRDQQVFGIRGRSVLREEEEDSTNATTSEEREVESVSVTTPTTSSSLVIIQTATNNNVIAVRNRSSRNRRNYLQYLHPVIFPPLISNRVIPLPEFPPERNGRSNTSTVVPSEAEDSLASSSFRLGEAIAFSHADLNCELSRDNNNAMVALTNLWNCECPVPGSKPLVVCKDCRRREHFDWTWDPELTDPSVVFQNSNRDVLFNPGFSVGTIAVRGSAPLQQGYHHYWEIEMSTQVYGTDMMIGVGTDKTDLHKHANSFVSLIGLDEHSWGLSYMGMKHHNGLTHHYTKTFGQYTVVGIHLDLWSGRMEFYINRKPLGIAFTGLQGKVLYPMISSTAARSGMNLVFCRSYAPSLQLQTMLSLSKGLILPDNITLFKVLPDDVIPPGLKTWIKNNFWWITSGSKNDEEKQKKPTAAPVPKIFTRKTRNLPPASSGTSGTSSVPDDSPAPSPKMRRLRKSKKDDHLLCPFVSATILPSVGVVTRSMATRRVPLPMATHPIFAPAPELDLTPSTSMSRLQEVRRPMTRSNSSPSVRNLRNLHDDEPDENDDDLPPRAASSASNSSNDTEPGSKRMCLRSSSKR